MVSVKFPTRNRILLSSINHAFSSEAYREDIAFLFVSSNQLAVNPNDKRIAQPYHMVRIVFLKRLFPISLLAQKVDYC